MKKEDTLQESVLDSVVEVKYKLVSPISEDKRGEDEIFSIFTNMGFDFFYPPKINFSLGDKGKIEMITDASETDNSRIVFVNFSSGVRFILSDDSISFNFSKGTYPGWDKYKTLIEEIVQALLNTMLIEHFSRTMIRFSRVIIADLENNIKFHSELIGLKDFTLKNFSLEERKDNMTSFVGFSKEKTQDTAEGDISLLDINIFQNIELTKDINKLMASLNSIYQKQESVASSLLS